MAVEVEYTLEYRIERVLQEDHMGCLAVLDRWDDRTVELEARCMVEMLDYSCTEVL
jgi:hypothetical protein